MQYLVPTVQPGVGCGKATQKPTWNVSNAFPRASIVSISKWLVGSSSMKKFGLKKPPEDAISIKLHLWRKALISASQAQCLPQQLQVHQDASTSKTPRAGGPSCMDSRAHVELCKSHPALLAPRQADHWPQSQISSDSKGTQLLPVVLGILACNRTMWSSEHDAQLWRLHRPFLN